MKLLDGEEKLAGLLDPLPPEFEASGLSFDGRELEEDELDLGPSVWYKFSNKQSHIKLKIAFADGWITRISLSRGKNEYFGLKDYLKFHQRTGDLEMLQRHEDDTAIVFAFLCTLIATDWFDLITGKRWEQVPVPDRLDY